MAMYKLVSIYIHNYIPVQFSPMERGECVKKEYTIEVAIYVFFNVLRTGLFVRLCAMGIIFAV